MSKLIEQALLEIQKNNIIIRDRIVSMSNKISAIQYSISSLDGIPAKIAKILKEKTEEDFKILSIFDNPGKKCYGYEICEAQREIEKWIVALLEDIEDIKDAEK